ncbi:hypothetical protein VaNZ11_013050, partial [Volvox africanus]
PGRVVLLGVDLSGQRQLDDRVLEEGLLEGLTAQGRERVRLRHLSLARCSLTDSSLLGLALCPPLHRTLRHLDISGNSGIRWDEPSWRWALMGCTALHLLNVQHTGMDTAGILALVGILYDIQCVRRSLAVFQAGPPTNVLRRSQAAVALQASSGFGADVARPAVAAAATDGRTRLTAPVHGPTAMTSSPPPSPQGHRGPSHSNLISPGGRSGMAREAATSSAAAAAARATGMQLQRVDYAGGDFGNA